MGEDNFSATTPCGVLVPLILPADLNDQNLNTFKTFLQLMTRHDKMHGSDAVVLIQPIAEFPKDLPKRKFIPIPISQLEKNYSMLAELNQQGYSLHWSLNEYCYMGQLPPRRLQQ